jgi:hypothetical protein
MVRPRPSAFWDGRRSTEAGRRHIARYRQCVDHQRKTVSNLERDNQDATIAKALLRVFEKALAVHVADRDHLLKELDRG